LTDPNTSKVPGLLEYKFKVTVAGIYRLRLRSWCSSSFEHNDFWTRIATAKNVTGEWPLGSKGSEKTALDPFGWTKTAQNNPCGWNWNTKTRGPDSISPSPPGRVVFNLAVGVHTFQLKPRSSLIAIDKIAIYRFDNVASDGDKRFNETYFNTAKQSTLINY